MEAEAEMNCTGSRKTGDDGVSVPCFVEVAAECWCIGCNTREIDMCSFFVRCDDGDLCQLECNKVGARQAAIFELVSLTSISILHLTM